MKRSRVVFVVLVLGLIGLGILRERRMRGDPWNAVAVMADEPPVFGPLATPMGSHALRGRVTTVEGEPAGDVQVFLYPAEPNPGAEPVHLAYTGADGRFALEELTAGTYGVVLDRAGHAPKTLAVEIPLGSWTSEAGADESASAPGDVASEVVWSLDPPLPPLEVLPEIRRADLAGHVVRLDTDEDAGSLGGYEVALVPQEGTHPLSGAVVRRTTTSEDGSFRIAAVVAADYDLELLPPWARGGSWPRLDRLGLSHTPEADFVPTLRIRAGRIESRLEDQAGRPIEGALVRLWPEEHPERIWPPATTDGDGRFAVGDLPAGRYRLRVRAGASRREVSVDVEEGRTVRPVFEPLDPRPE